MGFRWLTMTRRGSWQSFRKFILDEKRDVIARIATIEDQQDQIGTLFITYQKQSESKKATQMRDRFWVTKDSSLEKLVKVYIAMGGNPLDISMFISPVDIDLVDLEGTTYFENTSLGGVVAPLTGGPDEEVYTGGWLNWNKDPKWRIGNADIPRPKQMWAMHTIKKSRGWTEKEIRAKKNKIEEKIIKLCDLHEQLEVEKALLERRTRDWAAEKRTDFSLQQPLEYAIHLVDSIYWKQTDGTNGDPDNPRLMEKDSINKPSDEIANDEDIQKRTHHMNFFEDAEGEEYPITDL